MTTPRDFSSLLASQGVTDAGAAFVSICDIRPESHECMYKYGDWHVVKAYGSTLVSLLKTNLETMGLDAGCIEVTPRALEMALEKALEPASVQTTAPETPLEPANLQPMEPGNPSKPSEAPDAEHADSQPAPIRPPFVEPPLPPPPSTPPAMEGDQRVVIVTES